MAGIFKDGFRTTLHWVSNGQADQFSSVNVNALAASANFNLTIPITEVTPPGLDGGGSIDLTNMLSGAMRQKWHPLLKELTPVDFTAFYSHLAHYKAFSLINANYKMWLKFPDNSYIEFYGFMSMFKPNAHREKEPPTAACQIVPTNISAAGYEILPYYYNAPAGQVNTGANDLTSSTPTFSWF